MTALHTIELGTRIGLLPEDGTRIGFLPEDGCRIGFDTDEKMGTRIGFDTGADTCPDVVPDWMTIELVAV